MNHTNGKKEAERIALMLEGLCIYRSLLADPAIRTFLSLCRSLAQCPDSPGASGTSWIPVGEFINNYSELFHKLSMSNYGPSFQEYVFERILLDENPFTVSSSFPERKTDPAVLAAAISDLHALKSAVSLPGSLLKKAILQVYPEAADYRDIIEALPDWAELAGKVACTGVSRGKGVEDLKRFWNTGAPAEKLAYGLMEYHASNGYGIFAQKYAFTWQRCGTARTQNPGKIPANDSYGSLVPVHNPDPVRLSDLIGYESEREEVIRNTEQFLEGYVSNNALLYGDRGTGKSSTVKALLNEYAGRGLRMVEVPKILLEDFPEIVGILADKPYKFILFVDDLSFEDSEDSYTALKAVIEGGLEIRPQNVLIYATTNRRHLVRENFSDRLGLQYGGKDDEIRAVDTMQEKLSLSDRFGITVVFASPDKKRFLEIVDALARKKGVDMDPETLHREALKWEMWYNGRSPRTAQQFINYISCKNHM